MFSREGRRNGNRSTNRFATAVLSAIILAAVAATSIAALPAPSWMPGFPLLAGGQAILMWTPVPGAVKYKVFLDGKVVGEVPAFQHTISAPETAGTHLVEVVAVGADGTDGARSKAGEIRIFVLAPPGGIVTRVLEDRSVTFRWDKPEGALLFNVYRAEGKTGEFKQIASVQDVRHTDKDLKEGILYRYAITAKDVSGKESKFSKEIPIVVEKKEEAAKRDEIKRMVRVTKIAWTIKGAMGGGISGPNDIDIDNAKGLLYVSNLGGKNIIVLNTKGEFQKTIGTPGKNTGEISEPKGIGISRDGSVLYVADSGTSRVLSFNTDTGAFIAEFVLAKSDSMKNTLAAFIKTNEAQAPAPVDVAVSPDGSELAVADNSRSKILIYDTQGRFQREISTESANRLDLGVFSFPNKVKYNANKDHYGDIAASDVFGSRFQVFDAKSGKWKVAFGSLGQSIGTFKAPIDAVFEKGGDILVSDKDNYVIQGFGYDGKFKYLLGQEDGNPVNMGSPMGMALGDDGTLYVVDYWGARVVALKMTDKVLEK